MFCCERRYLKKRSCKSCEDDRKIILNRRIPRFWWIVFYYATTVQSGFALVWSNCAVNNLNNSVIYFLYFYILKILINI